MHDRCGLQEVAVGSILMNPIRLSFCAMNCRDIYSSPTADCIPYIISADTGTLLCSIDRRGVAWSIDVYGHLIHYARVFTPGYGRSSMSYGYICRKDIGNCRSSPWGVYYE